ncbi:MAG: restriction endonuclease subunit S [Kordiimonadaceae bacterium]|nr:restriction endonuclease subunit S [Kordiimonadaceae bacterium]
MSWTESSIGDITSVVTKGTTPTTDGMGFTDYGVNYIKAGALNGDSSLSRPGFTFISNETHEKLARSQLALGDVLVTIAGANVGKVGFVQEKDLPANTNQAVGIIRVDPVKAIPKFVYYHFKNPVTFAKSQGIGGGQAAQPNINLTVLKKFEINLPDKDQQNKIADVLSAYDNLIENNKRRIELLEESARQLYKEWFVRFRFPGHEHVQTVDGVPADWIKTVLGEIVQTNANSHKAKELPETINYIDISSVETGTIGEKTTLNSEEAPGRARRIAKHGDIIWSNVRPNLKAYALVQNPNEIDVFSTGFTVLSAEKVPYLYLYQFVTTSDFVAHLVNHATGTSYPAVRPPDFEKADIVIPTDDLLEQYQEICEPSFDLIHKLKEQNYYLAEARDLFLPKLMSGEIAV